MDDPYQNLKSWTKTSYRYKSQGPNCNHPRFPNKDKGQPRVSGHPSACISRAFRASSVLLSLPSFFASMFIIHPHSVCAVEYMQIQISNPSFLLFRFPICYTGDNGGDGKRRRRSRCWTWVIALERCQYQRRRWLRRLLEVELRWISVFFRA